MAVAELDEKTYGKLLVRALPKITTSDAENDRMIAELERLDSSGRRLTLEQQALAELMTLLIERYELERYPLGHATPLEAVRSIRFD